MRSRGVVDRRGLRRDWRSAGGKVARSTLSTWTSLDEPGRQQQKFVRNRKAAFGRGLDVYGVMIRRCRERGVSPWLSFRMNDIHGTQQTTDPMVSAFWKEHPEWHIGKDSGWEKGLDYAQKPVRDRMVAFIREALERYDADGIELDFIRFPHYFRKGTERTNAPILTAFLREIRAICDMAAKRRGHPVKIAARFLPNPTQAVGMGADVGVWSKEGLLDMAIACNMYGSIEYEYHVDAWRTVLTDKTQFITGTDNGIVENGKRRILNLGEYRDWISKMRKDGADGLYFFNFPIRPYRDEAWRSVLGAGASLGNGVLAVVSDSEVATVRSARYAQPPVGWMSWYALKFATDDEKILDNARRFRNLFSPYCNARPMIWVGSSAGRRRLRWTERRRRKNDYTLRNVPVRIDIPQSI